MGLLAIYVGFALGVSFVCSLTEAVLFSARAGSLHDRAKHGDRGAALLLDLKRHRIDDAISAVLAVNTVANTLGATLAGARAAAVFGSAWVGVFSAVLTLLILVLSEIVPKTLGAVYAAGLAGPVGWLLYGLTRAMAPVLVVSRFVTRLLTSGRKVGFSRSELSAVIAAATQDGAISAGEARILENLLRLSEVRVEDVMTPRTVTFLLPADSTVGQLLERPEARYFSRIPIFRGTHDDIVGYVLHRDVLGALARGGDRSRRLDEFLRPIHFVPDKATVWSALRQIIERREPIAMVTDEHGGIEGLVTLEDLTETILGVEIIDEVDEYADMRQAAVRLREERVERARRLREGEGA